jgi:hypothetical protein
MFPLVVHRLHNQRLADPGFRRAADVVRRFGAVQAQAFGPAKWALGLRADGIREADVDAAFDRGLILRTHVMRPTWHFVPAADISWMLALTGPRVSAMMRSYNRRLELDGRTFARSHDAIARALEGGRFLTRAELAGVLARAGIEARGQRLGHLVMQAELDRIVCSGPRRGRQFTYALLSERAPRAAARTRDEALGELARRYFRSHGPASLRDFGWWSGLTMPDVRAAVSLARPSVRETTIDGRPYWSASRGEPRPGAGTHLLPIYDEYLIAYRERDAVAGPAARAHAACDPFGHWVVTDGRLGGTWRQRIDNGTLRVEVALCGKAGAVQRRDLAASAQRLGRFLDATVALTVHRGTDTAAGKGARRR